MKFYKLIDCNYQIYRLCCNDYQLINRTCQWGNSYSWNFAYILFKSVISCVSNTYLIKKILLKIITYPQRNCSVQNVCKQAWHDRRPKHFLFCVLTFELYVTRRANVRCHASKLSNEFSKYEIKSAFSSSYLMLKR